MMPHAARFLLLGSVLGASLGLTQVAVASGVWVEHGQPDFYFRGWEAVRRGLVLWSVGGFAAGVPFGVTVAVGEYLLGRRVWVIPAILSAAVATAAATWGLVEFEFSRRELLPAFTHEAATVATAAAFLLMWSRPAMQIEQHTTAGGRRAATEGGPYEEWPSS